MTTKAHHEASAKRRPLILEGLADAGPAGMTRRAISERFGGGKYGATVDLLLMRAQGLVAATSKNRHHTTWVLIEHLEQGRKLAEERVQQSIAEAPERNRARKRKYLDAEAEKRRQARLKKQAQRQKANESALQKFLKKRQTVVREWAPPACAPGPRSVFELGA